MHSITLTRPDDWHIHLRDGERLRHTVADCARYLGRAIVMPNLTPPVTTVEQAVAYHDRIRARIPPGLAFQPLMTLYLTPQTSVECIREASAHPLIHAIKLYPAGATTHSDAGVTSIEACYPLFEAMQAEDLPLLIHGEVTDPAVDIFDREAVFIDRHLDQLVRRFAELRIVLEHITTANAVEFVESADARIAATITAHHLLYNRNHMLAGGLRSPFYCLPVLKRERHQLALIAAATSGNRRFFLGTDSAPHPMSAKENADGCAAGSYTAHASLELYAEVFEAEGRLDRLEAFASHHGADFYGLPRNTDRVRLVRVPWQVPRRLPLGDETLVPIRAGESLGWSVRPVEGDPGAAAAGGGHP